MKKKLIFSLLISTILFGLNIKLVDAGVCNGLQNQKYCSSPWGGISFAHNDNLSWRTTSSGYFMKTGYTANFAGSSYPAFCIDPGLSSPAVSYYNVRELDLRIPYDDGAYRIYERLINDTISSSSDVNTYRAYFQFALRAWTLKEGNGYLSAAVTNFDGDAANFARCVYNHIDNSVNLNSLGLASTGECSQTYGFGNSYHNNLVKAYYYMVGQNYIWDNPLKDSNAVETRITEPTATDSNYHFAFVVHFVNNSDFFDFANGVGSLGLSPASFEGHIAINSQDCLPGSPCDANVYNAKSYISQSQGNTANEVSFDISFTPEQYNKYFPDGNGTISLKYTYNHPMNSENVFVSRDDPANPSYQRMFIVKNYFHDDSKTITIGNSPQTSNKCSHTSSGFIDNLGNNLGYNNNVLALNNYISNTNCGCEKVNKYLLSGSALDYYKNNCDPLTITNEGYSGGMYACTGDSYENYDLGYNKTTKINSYCNEICNEKINVYDLKGKFSTVSGTYFEFEKYPNLIANKKCTVNIKISDWESEYSTKLRSMVDAYNDWQANIITSYSYTGCNCSEFGCSDSRTHYHYSYRHIDIGSNGLTLSSHPVSGTYSSSCGGSLSFNPNGKRAIFQSKISDIPDMQDNLKQCTNRLSNITDGNFYKFQEKLNYYYYQSLSKYDTPIKNSDMGNSDINNTRIDDSEFIKNEGPVSSSYDLNNSYTKNYYTLDSSGNIRINSLNVQPNINREVEYKYNYVMPKQKKYVNVYTGYIRATVPLNNSLKHNYVELGNVYDTDVSALAKNNNDTYYAFSKLGDANNNKLFEHFKNSTTNSINRYCTYETKNEIIVKKKMNLVYRIVDPNNIDPNGRKASNNGFKNWDNTMIDTANNMDNFNPANLEYSFKLNSKTMTDIRVNVNKDSSYSDLKDYTCNSDGNQCTSEFVTKYAIKTNGRSNWK